MDPLDPAILTCMMVVFAVGCVVCYALGVSIAD